MKGRNSSVCYFLVELVMRLALWYIWNGSKQAKHLIGCRNWFYSLQTSVHLSPCGTRPGTPRMKSPMSHRFLMIRSLATVLSLIHSHSEFSKPSPSNAQNSESHSKYKYPSWQSQAPQVATGCGPHFCLLRCVQTLRGRKNERTGQLLSDQHLCNLAFGSSGGANSVQWSSNM